MMKCLGESDFPNAYFRKIKKILMIDKIDR